MRYLSATIYHLMRLDRLLTIYLFNPLKRAICPKKGVYIPILMYHSISEDKENGIHPYYKVSTSPDVFAEHMNFLHENNYSVISLALAVKILNSYSQPNQPVNQLTGQPLSESNNKPLNYTVITFDDGFCDFYSQAFPILQKYDFTSTVFLPTGIIGNEETGIKGKKHLDWSEVRDLHANGIDFGSHTVTHPKLKELKKDEIEYEIKHSKEMIEEKLGNPIESFSYPYAFPEENKELTEYIQCTLQKAGYRYGVSTMIGRSTNKDEIFFLKRLPVNSCDDPKLFKAKLEGGYDWLNRPQYLSKALKQYF